ncbi:single-stranded DNA-binding protein [Metamycoplasma equirhinis]|uniref:single-stranded DNA-binding protein n=1 Tax=Metamycoplasma equirhinis TaxID=92402 RepID=UPI0035940B70
MISVEIIGRIATDIEVSTFATKNQNTITQAKFRVAASQNNANFDNDIFLSCVVRGKAAEFTSKYLTKGSPVLLRGTISTFRPDKDNSNIVYYITVSKVNSLAFSKSKTTNEDMLNPNQQDSLPTFNSEQIFDQLEW